MLGHYPNSNPKPRGSNLNKKIQELISLTFHKHLCWLTYIETSKRTNKHKHTQTLKTHIYTYTHLLITSKHTYINTCIHNTYIRINIYTQIHTYITICL